MLQLLLDALPNQPVNLDKLADGRKALFDNDLVKHTTTSFGNLSAKHKFDVIHAICFQSRIAPDNKGTWPSPFSDLWTAGVLCRHMLSDEFSSQCATVSMPLPTFLPCLRLCGIPIPEYLDRDSKWFDPSKAFEVVVTLWAASKYSSLRHFCGELAGFKELVDHKEGNVFAVFADCGQQAKSSIAGAGVYQVKKRKKKNQAQSEKRMVLIQTKRAQSKHLLGEEKQQKQEVMEFVEWALENTVCAITVIFITDRSENERGYQEEPHER